MKKTIILILMCFVSITSLGQGKVNLTVQARAIISTDSIKPFWTRANQYGTVPLKGNLYSTSISAYQTYDSLFNHNKKLNSWDWGFGIDVHALNNNAETLILLPELYAKVRWKDFEFYAGRRREVLGLADTTSTSGSYIWSGNALPMPKIQLHTTDYLPLLKSGFLGVKAGIAHGWFGSNGIVDNYFLHQKWLYGRIGKIDSKVQFSAGINHQVQWGGYSETLKDAGGQFPPTLDGFLAPYPIYSYQYVLIPFLQKIKTIDKSKVPGYDAGLAIGNHLGSVDIGFKLLLKNTTLLIYSQQPYDFARSLVNFNNIQDGLYGVSFTTKLPALNKICLEFFDSRSQGKYRFGKIQESNFGEVDSYFYHGQYQSWSYRNLIIGNPFIIDKYIDGQNYFNNRVRYYYTNLGGVVGKMKYQAKYAFSQNYGIYGSALDLDQHSMQVLLSRDLSYHLRGTLGINIDRGYLYPNNEGLELQITYKF